MVSNNNVNCLASIQYGIRLVQLIANYFKVVDEDVVKENFVTLQAIIDETIDFGYPQLTCAEAFNEFLPPEGLDAGVVKNVTQATGIAKKLTGPDPWRKEGLVYRVSELFVDVVEEINLLMSSTGEVLQREVGGRIVMNNFLSGMPRCTLSLNARAIPEKESRPLTTFNTESIENAALAVPSTNLSIDPTIQLDDVSFHSCVRLNKFGEEQKIEFTPPDGEMTLMRYRSRMTVEPPLLIQEVKVEEFSKTRVSIQFVLVCQSDSHYNYTEIVVRVPCPDNTGALKSKVTHGKAKYDAHEGAILWTLPSVTGGQSYPFNAELRLIALTDGSSETVWSRPPIGIQFKCVSQSLTGLRINELQVEEPVFLYSANKWIRYTTQAGEYKCRI
ncbi:AP-2 complex subunit mu-1 [Angomonas deanei]|uniref:Adaptor complexes medium subunit family, putative n=1 Tax=Angomonas deanei TaxID=59799 RepID=A0A7G2C4K3_9TRYP|nr:AP-2 complex subunit mu-1 [Angomonas deanei]CAD2214435.1 Adaptor complexes medium subunit family, putative [Angomonas deanei]|eukprot:EPY29081.1 AP-2 complex subunit mu-1 [Angomonas deanei]